MSERKRQPKRSGSWDLDIKPLTDSERAASERVANRILGKLEPAGEGTGERAEVRETNKVSGTKLVHETTVVRDQEATRSETNEVRETNIVHETPFAVVDGYTAVPNTVLDTLWAALDEFETKVYVRLYRLSHGFGNDMCRVGLDRLAASCKLSRSTIQRTLDRLEYHGLVAHVTGAAARGVGRERGITKGNVYRVTVPGGNVVPRTKLVSGTKKVRETNEVPETPSKEHEKKHVNAPVAVAPALGLYDVRTIGARLFERHRSDPGFSHERLAELVADALAAQGITPNGELIEEAIRGMG